MSRKSWLLILPLTKKLGGAFEHSFEFGHANLKKFKFQMPGQPEGWGVEVSHRLNHQSVTAYSHYKQHTCKFSLGNSSNKKGLTSLYIGSETWGGRGVGIFSFEELWPVIKNCFGKFRCTCSLDKQLPTLKTAHHLCHIEW